MAARGADKGRRGYANALVDDGNTYLAAYLFARSHKVLGACRYLVVYLVAAGFKLSVGTIKQAYAHRDGAHVEVFLLNHVVGL